MKDDPKKIFEDAFGKGLFEDMFGGKPKESKPQTDNDKTEDILKKMKEALENKK